MASCVTGRYQGTISFPSVVQTVGASGNIHYKGPVRCWIQSLSRGRSPGVEVTSTSSEDVINDHFELDRSMDGRVFMSVATIPAMAGSGDRQYEWLDEDAAILNSTKVFLQAEDRFGLRDGGVELAGPRWGECACVERDEKLAAGIYVVSVYFDKQLYTFKVVKED